MGETPSTFHPSFNAGVVIEARVERLTSDAGAVIVREVMERGGIIEWLTERLHDPRQPHLLTYPLADLLRTMLLLFAQGRCLSKELSGAASGRVSDFAVFGVALGVETDVADRRPVADLA